MSKRTSIAGILILLGIVTYRLDTIPSYIFSNRYLYNNFRGEKRMIKDKLKEKRKESKITQEMLAEKLHVSRTTISSWETGRTYPDLNMVVKISDIFDVSLDYLLKGDEKVVRKISKDSQKGRIYTKISIILGILILLIGIYFLVWKVKVNNLYQNIYDQNWTENKFDYSKVEDSIEYKVNKVLTYKIWEIPNELVLTAEAKYTEGNQAYINGVSIIDYDGNKDKFKVSWSNRDLIGQTIFMDSSFEYDKNLQPLEQQTVSYEFEKIFNNELEVERPYMNDYLNKVEKEWLNINK